ncbi:MAG TPA: UdgX family uracil-DNA binding protein, partial [Acidimicrobiales bacterium]|nr:UdgX family uracil-DNA binding protein [Acidimicrobiales bacterium]
RAGTTLQPVPPAAVPVSASLAELASAAAGCQACGLWEQATQTVFGEGPAGAAVALVGEQPGDVEDRQGAPFVGPAGRVLDQALSRAGIPRERAYVTNAVKHFKWKPRGKRRLHQRPNTTEVAACRPWLDAELAAVAPEVVVLLGATAAQAVLGPTFRVSRDRGRFVESPLEPRVLATVHPSSILRGPAEERDTALQGLVDDLAVVAASLA